MNPANEHNIDDLLVMYLLDEADSEQRIFVDEWIADSTENKKYFDHLSLIWHQSKNVDISDNISEEEAWRRFKQRTSQQSSPGIVKPINSSFPWIRVAAIILIAAGLAYLSLSVLSNRSQQVVLVSAAAPFSKTLPDGSSVTLNRDSKITYNKGLKGTSRKLALQGEAYFNVKGDKDKPFVVRVNDITVKVIGTSFNIDATDDSTEIIVKSGIVEVSRNGRYVTLRASDKLVIGSKGELIKQKEYDELYNYYETKQFICNNTPLWKLVAKLNEVYAAKIIIQRKELANLPLTTIFKNEKLDNILQVISETFDITISREGDTVILK